MPRLRALLKSPPLAKGDAEQQLEELRDYLLQIVEELGYLLTHLEADNINDTTFERIQSMIPRPYTGLPVMDGDASAGQSEQWARGDHRHGHDNTKADVTALAAHIADRLNPHAVTKAQVGLGNVADERQYSAQNPPPLPTPADIGAATAQDLSDHVNDTANPHGVTAAQAGARPDTWMPTASDVGAQPTITASGILKGDGQGGVSAAVAGTDYQAPIDLSIVNGKLCVIYEVTP